VRLQVKINTTKLPLNIRSGPGTSYKITGELAKGSTTIVNSVTTVSKQKWYHLENGKGYIYAGYTTIIANLETNTSSKTNTTKPKTTTQTKPPAEPTPDYDRINELLDKNDISKSGIAFGSNFTPSTGVNSMEPIFPMQNDEGFPKQVGSSGGVKIYDYFTDYNFIQKNLKSVESNINLINYGFKTVNYNLFHKFNRFKVAFPDYHLGKTFSYIFFTRPDLNLVDYQGSGKYILAKQVTNDPLYYYLYRNNPDIIFSLSSSFSGEHDFMPFLSNGANSFEISDEYIKTTEHGETFTGHKLQYGKHNIESKTAGTFSIAYTDDQELTIYKIHKAWIEYISKVYRGELLAKPEYIRKKVLDYACSVYYVLCGADGETILFWSKYYGVFPTNTPSSTTSWTKGSQVKIPEYTINYAYSFKDDFSPLLLAEFNMNSKTQYVYRKVYEPELIATGKTLVNAPFIESRIDGSGEYVFKLRFRD
jgi:hypothetical protein